MKTLGYYNGRFDELERMQIPMNDRVCFFGDGVYDAGPCHSYHILPWMSMWTAFLPMPLP